MLTSKQIRSSFIDFFKDRGHQFVPSSPIVPADDGTLLFANAGMNQFKNIFLGLVRPDHPKAVNSQKCLRVSGKHNDLEEVGKDTYHHTFFEMLGNWSFDDYFKAEAIEWAWDLLTKEWGIAPDSLWATVFAGDQSDGLPKDEEAANLWTKLTPISPDKVLPFGKKDNFWEMGEVGPCGPCSEIHIDLGPQACDKKGVPGHTCRVNGDCARFIELWNLVFIQFNRQNDGKLVGLSARYVDTGAGLERIAAVLQGKRSNYDTDLFMPIIDRTAQVTGHTYTGQLGNKSDNAFRVLADHVRALVFAITDGATPSNDGRGYVIRRILRRAARYGRELGMHEPFIYRLVPVVVECLGEAFGEIKERAQHVSTVIQSEEESFGRTIDRGIEIFAAAAERASRGQQKIISGQDAFALYDTYGFPLDLTELMAVERGLTVDKTRFDELMEQQRERARAAQKTDPIMGMLTDTELPATDDTPKYHADTCRATIVGWIDGEGFHDRGRVASGQVGLILDKTCFYAEAGGQVGDFGVICAGEGVFEVEHAAKIANCVVHRGNITKGCLDVGQAVQAAVSAERRSTMKNHTATHLLQWALQQVLGRGASQQGSYVCPEYLRFDFTYPKPLSPDQIKSVEKLVRDKIEADSPVASAVMKRDEAQQLGAMALFGEKYGREVRVVGLGVDNAQDFAQAFSREFCGGTHVPRLGVIGGFKIIKEESISTGVRRITALTGVGLTDYFAKATDIVDQLTEILKVPAEQLPERLSQLLEQNKRLAKELKAASRSAGADTIAEARLLLEKCAKAGESAIITGQLSPTSVERAREAIDMLKKKAQSAAIVLGFEDDGKAVLLAGVTDDLVRRGVKAGDIVREISPIVDGGGGGKPQMAQAGGKNPARLPEALTTAAEMIRRLMSQ